MGPTLRHAFQEQGGYTFSDCHCLDYIRKGSNKIRFQYGKNSHDVLLYIRAMQGHTGGEVISPELMGHDTVPFRWNFCFREDAL